MYRDVRLEMVPLLPRFAKTLLRLLDAAPVETATG